MIIDKNPTLLASESNEFVYCPMAFYLKRAGMDTQTYETATPEEQELIRRQLELIAAGRTVHREIADKVEQIARKETLAKQTERLGAGLLALGILNIVRTMVLFCADLLFSFILIAFSVYFRRSSTSLRKRFGVPPGKIRYVDGIRMLSPKVLYSRKYELKGKPDMIILENKQFIPIKHKPTSTKAYENHIIQLIAYCILVEETYGITPSHGVLVLKDGKKEQVEFTEKRREKLLEILQHMRQMFDAQQAPAYFTRFQKCRTCRYERICNELLRGSSWKIKD